MSAALSVGEVVVESARTTLYRARRLEDGLPLLLKVPRSETAGPHQARLEREFAIAGRIESASVVKVHGVTSHQGRPALLVEDFGGRSLDRLLGEPLPVEAFLRLALGAAHALGEVHRHGVVHRDIKPQNIIVQPETGAVKITDFGIAWMRGADIPPAEGVEGTFAYMAPEQTGRIDRPVDHRADLYSLGVTFYEMLTGARPFEGRDPLEWIHGHIARVPRPPAQITPTVPPILSSLVLRLLAKTPEERYQSADGLEADLERCLRAWSATSSIADFPLGIHDVADEFRVPHKLFGREREIARVTEIFERVVSSRQPAVLLVTGYSGIGKTSLVNELHAPVALAHGFFAAGKFDQYRRHVPYSALAQAVRELVHQALSASGERLGRWRAELNRLLGGTGGVLTDVFPGVESLIGPQPTPPPLGPAEARNRFNLAFRGFVQAFATPEHPVVLFLDDMQWADTASLDLLETLLAGGGGPLVVLLAYRQNEVDAAHPFTNTVERLRASGLPVDALTVPPLDEASVGALVAETVHAPPEACAGLARLVMEKTAGNPFFVNEFLKTLHSKGLLRFDRDRSSWCWDLAEIERTAITDNVVDLMIERLRGLPPAAQNALRSAACIGNVFELEHLAIVTESAPPETAAALRPAIEEGLLRARAGAGGGVVYRFEHDRIQQAAYALIERDRRREAHLKIGRLLWKSLGPEELEAKLFEVVNHLQAALPLLTDPAERAGVAELGVLAARRAKSATAYGEARNYLATALQLLAHGEGAPGRPGHGERPGSAPDNAAPPVGARIFGLETELAECEYLSGRLGEARARFEALLDGAPSDLERGQILALQIKLFQVAGDFEEAVAISLRSFEIFGLPPPPSDEEAARAVASAHEKVTALLAGRRPADLLDAPPVRDAKVGVLLELLEASGPPLYMVKPALFPWIVLQMVRLSLEHGHTEASSYGYGVYAILRAATMNDVEGGHQFSWLAIRLQEKLRGVRLGGCVYHLLGDHVNFWKNPIATDLPILDRGFSACIEAGDLIYANYIGFQSPWHLYEAGAPLDDVWVLTEKYAAFALGSKYLAVHQTIRLEQQFILNLKGLSDGRETFDGGGFEEERALAEITAARFGCGVVYYHILKLVSRFTYGDYRGALASAQAAARDLGAAFSMPIEITFYLFHALTLASLYPEADEGERVRFLETLERYRAEMARWAAACPENFGHKLALVGAEIARVTGRTDQAMRLYEEAIGAAREQRFTQYQALASERAAMLYLGAGATSVGNVLLQEASALYRRWGALGKVAEIEERHPELVSHPGRLGRAPTSSTVTGNDQLDLLSVMKASQSISGEMVLPRLLERLITIVVEYAAAERGALLLAQGGRLRVVAEGDGTSARALGSTAGVPPSGAELPLSILHYVQRTGERVLVDDAVMPNPFSADEYVHSKKPRSILCIPIGRQGKLTGMFYLENNLVSGAFSPSRLTVLDLLAAQTAISIDNSRLYKEAQDAVAARDEFLSIASHELRTPLTPLKLRLGNLASHLRKGTLATMPPQRIGELLSASDAQLTRLTALIENLLDVSRIQAGRLHLDRAPVDLCQLVGDVLIRHSGEIASARCTITVDAPRAVVGCWDRLRIEQVVTNLLTNAVKYAPGKAIALVVAGAGGRARLTITDAGIGIAVEDLSRIFDRFERVTSKNNVGGLGLGLFITRQIVEAHGGSIDVRSVLGAGTTFVMELPMEESRDGKTRPSGSSNGLPAG